MKINNEISNEVLKNRLQELCGNFRPKHSEKNSNLEYTAKSVNNVNYGILKEGSHYFIKDSTKVDGLLTESDFNYIGGLRYKLDYRYNSYSDALKNLNMLFNTIYEGYTPEQVPEPQPEQAPEAQPQPESQPTDSLPDSSITDDSADGIKNIDHFLGKLTYEIRNTPEEDFSDEKVKAIMNSLISALPLLKISPEERLELAKRVNSGGNDDSENDEMPPTDSLDELPMDTTEQPQPEELRESSNAYLTNLILDQLKK